MLVCVCVNCARCGVVFLQNLLSYRPAFSQTWRSRTSYEISKCCSKLPKRTEASEATPDRHPFVYQGAVHGLDKTKRKGKTSEGVFHLNLVKKTATNTRARALARHTSRARIELYVHLQLTAPPRRALFVGAGNKADNVVFVVVGCVHETEENPHEDYLFLSTLRSTS